MGYKEAVGARLAQARKELELSPAQMAKAVNIVPEQWRRYERGESLPSFDVLAMLALRGMDVSHILVGQRQGWQRRDLSPDEIALLADYRRSASDDQRAIRDAAQAACHRQTAVRLQAAPPIAARLP